MRFRKDICPYTEMLRILELIQQGYIKPTSTTITDEWTKESKGHEVRQDAGKGNDSKTDIASNSNIEKGLVMSMAEEESLIQKWKALGRPAIPMDPPVTIVDLRRWLDTSKPSEDVWKVADFLARGERLQAETDTTGADVSRWQPVIIDPTTGWVMNPTLPCAKGEGFCRLRTGPDAHFQCIFQISDCAFRVWENA